MNRRQLALWGAGALLAMAMIALSLLALWAKRTLERPFHGYPEAECIVAVQPGTGVAQILGQLEKEGVIANAALARLYLERALDNPPLQAGEYRFAEPLSTPQVLDRLIQGQVITYPVTLIEGLTLEEQAAHLAAEGFGGEAAFLAAMRSPALIADLDPEATDLEGYLFPDTYHFARGLSEAAIVRTLMTTFRRHLQEGLAQFAVWNPQHPRALRELVTLASIVEKEARLDEERPVIAAVYRNRLDRGIALYADPTVIFALKQLGRWDGNLRRPDLSLDSPYNTYRYPGLPPGPIASPGLKSLLAAAAPAAVPYLYFVSRNDGSHVFAETLQEHNRNVYQHQVKYWRDRWANEKDEKNEKSGKK